MKCKALEIRWHETKPIFSADLHAVPPTQHAKPAHPYAKLAATGVTPDVDDAERQRRERDYQDRDKCWRLATCGGDNNVRLWLVTPRPHPEAPALSLPVKPLPVPAPTASSSSAPSKPAQKDPEPKVEYLATLSQHTGVVNCVRFAPFGDMLASAGDDGNILIWVPGESSKKMGETDEDRAYEKESWRVRSMIRSMSGKEIYDLAWSPTGDRLLAGSVDHTATIYDVLSGAPLYKIAEHTNYVQGVCWDPRGQLIATQSSDRSMHVYEVREAKKGGAGGIEVHAVGKNSRLEVQRRTLAASSSTASATGHGSLKRPRKQSEADLALTAAAAGGAAANEMGLSTAGSSGSTSVRPSMAPRASSTRSDVSDRSTATTATTAATTTEITTPMDPPSGIPHHPPPPPPRTHSHSRRSSTSGSQPSQSPRLTPVALPSHSLAPTSSSGGVVAPLPMRSPSPAPPLPAVMLPLSPKISSSSGPDEAASAGARPLTQTQTIKLYGDANSTPFFRRLSWSTDGSLLLTPAGLWEDPYAAAPLAASCSSNTTRKDGLAKSREKGGERATAAAGAGAAAAPSATEPRPTVYIYSRANVARPPVAHLPGHRTTSIAIRFCPVLFELRHAGKGNAAGVAAMPSGEGAAMDVEAQEGEESEGGAVKVELGAETKELSLGGLGSDPKGRARAPEDGSVGGGGGGGDDGGPAQGMFDLPYRMVYAVATLDSVYLYDTQQAGPIAMLGNLHYAPFTDLTWSVDGQTLVISSQDGYCSVVAFEPGELGTPCADQRPRGKPTALPIQPHPAPTAGELPPDTAGTTITVPTATAAKGEPCTTKDPGGGGALPALFAKVAATTSTSANDSGGTIIDLTTHSDSAASSPLKRPAGDDDGEQPPPPEKKQKKRVAPTLVRPLGT